MSLGGLCRTSETWTILETDILFYQQTSEEYEQSIGMLKNVQQR